MHNIAEEKGDFIREKRFFLDFVKADDCLKVYVECVCRDKPKYFDFNVRLTFTIFLDGGREIQRSCASLVFVYSNTKKGRRHEVQIWWEGCLKELHSWQPYLSFLRNCNVEVVGRERIVYNSI